MEWPRDQWRHWWKATAVVYSRHGPYLLVHEEKYIDGFSELFKIDNFNLVIN